MKSVGPIKRVEISYGPNGVSRGIANITFSRVDGANKALTALNGLLVDGKPMKVRTAMEALIKVTNKIADRNLSRCIPRPSYSCSKGPK